LGPKVQCWIPEQVSQSTWMSPRIVVPEHIVGLMNKHIIKANILI
jgi:hypothetical protein